MNELKRPEHLRVSESHLRQMAENIRDVFFLEDALSHDVQYVSPAYEEIWGRSCESLYANPQSWMESIHPDDQAMALENYTKGIPTGKFEFGYRIVRPDGMVRWIEVRCFPVRNDAGGLAGIAGVARDITEHKNDERELRESKQRLDCIVASAMDAIVCVDEQQRIILTNAATDQLFGYATGELLGKPLEVLVPARFHAGHAARVAAFDKTGTTVRKLGSLRPVTGVRKNGEEFPIEASISRHESTGRRFFTAIMRDITERKAAEETMHKRAEELERFHSLSVGRELQMIVLKKQVNAMAAQVGQAPPYDLGFLDGDALKTGSKP